MMEMPIGFRVSGLSRRESPIKSGPGGATRKGVCVHTHTPVIMSDYYVVVVTNSACDARACAITKGAPTRPALRLRFARVGARAGFMMQS